MTRASAFTRSTHSMPVSTTATCRNLGCLWDAVTALNDGADPNEAFGVVPSKGKHTEANRRKRRNLFPIMFRIYDLHYNKGEPLDESGAFRTTGKEFGYSAVTIRRMHDAAPELL